MVTATIERSILRLQLSPLHRALALKECLEIALDGIDRVERAPEIARSGPEGTRCPGTSLPYLIHAGSFTSGVRRTFWDVHNPDKAISIWTKRAMFAGFEDQYDQVVVEVADPTETINEIQKAVLTRQADGMLAAPSET